MGQLGLGDRSHVRVELFPLQGKCLCYQEPPKGGLELTESPCVAFHYLTGPLPRPTSQNGTPRPAGDAMRIHLKSGTLRLWAPRRTVTLLAPM